MHPEFWLGLWCGALGVGGLWCSYEAWLDNRNVPAWLASEQKRIDSETSAAPSIPHREGGE